MRSHSTQFGKISRGSMHPDPVKSRASGARQSNAAPSAKTCLRAFTSQRLCLKVGDSKWPVNGRSRVDLFNFFF